MACRDDAAHATKAHEGRALRDKHPAIAGKPTGTWQGEQHHVAATARHFRISEDDVRADAQQNHKRALGPR